MSDSVNIPEEAWATLPEFGWCPSCNDRHAVDYECSAKRMERRARERRLGPDHIVKLQRRLDAVKGVLDEFDTLDYRRKRAVNPHVLVEDLRAALEDKDGDYQGISIYIDTSLPEGAVAARDPKGRELGRVTIVEDDRA